MSQSVPACPAILSIIGWHANESPEDIVRRKGDDIVKLGHTIWLYHSQKASVRDVQQFGNLYSDVAVYFLDGGAFPAGTKHQAKEMSKDECNWSSLPMGIGKVTGRLPGQGLVIGQLIAVCNYSIDLWEFHEHSSLQPLRFRQGASTVCTVPAKSGPVPGMKSRIRRVVAIGRLASPYAVFLR